MSPSSMFKIASRNDGMDPVVMDLRRGIVTVGDRANAVNGMAAPSRMSLGWYKSEPYYFDMIMVVG